MFSVIFVSMQKNDITDFSIKTHIILMKSSFACFEGCLRRTLHTTTKLFRKTGVTTNWKVLKNVFKSGPKSSKKCSQNRLSFTVDRTPSRDHGGPLREGHPPDKGGTLLGPMPASPNWTRALLRVPLVEFYGFLVIPKRHRRIYDFLSGGVLVDIK